MTASASRSSIRQPRLPPVVVAGAILVVVLGLVAEALILANYLQVTRAVRPALARASQLLPQLSGLRTAVLQLHAETIPLLSADIPDYRQVETLRPDVEERLRALQQEAAGLAEYDAALTAVANMLETWDGEMEALRAGPDVPRRAVLAFEVTRSFAAAETALGDLYAVQEQEFYATTNQTILALGNIQGILLGLGLLIAGAGTLLFVTLRRSARTEIERAYDRLQAAADVGRAASSILDVDPLLGQVVNLIRDRFGFYHVSVFLLDDRGERAVLREATGEVGRRLKDAGHALGVGSRSVVGWVTANRSTRVVADVAADPVHFKNEMLPETRSELAVPLIVGGRLLGALDVQSRAPNAFAEVDVQALQGLADQVAIAIANAAQYGTQRVRSQKLAALSEAALQLTEPQPALGNLLDLAARRAMAVVNAEGAAIWLPAGSDEIELKVWYRGQSRQPPGRRLPRNEGLVARVWTGGQPIQAEGSADGLPGRGAAVSIGLAVPMVWQSGVTGLLVLARFRPAGSPLSGAAGVGFGDEDRDLARLFASQVAATIENFRLIVETQARVAELFSLNLISAALTREAPTALARPLGVAAEQMQSLFDVDHVRIVMFDAEASGPPLRSAAGTSGRSEGGGPGEGELVAEHPAWGLAGGRVSLREDPLAQEMLASRMPVMVASVGQDARLAEGPASQNLLRLGVQSLIWVPLLAGEGVLGFISLETVGRQRHLNEGEINLCRTIAAQVAIVVQNARLFDQTDRLARRERLINQITDRIRRAVDVPGVLAATAAELGAALGASRAHIEVNLEAPAPRPARTNNSGQASGNGREVAG